MPDLQIVKSRLLQQRRKTMKFIKSNKYDKKFINENLMGPNSMKMLEELLQSVKLEKGMRVWDLGCGKGLTSIVLAKEFGVQVFATAFWIGATETYKPFKSLNLENRIIPIHADAGDLPYADEYFDAIVSIDSYYYFGTEPEFMDTKLAPLQATNKFMWAYLAHTKFKGYTVSRWINNPDNDKIQGTISERFFVAGQNGLIRMNAISRLWWAGYLTYDENNPADPYHLTKILLTGQQIWADILRSEEHT